MGERTKVLRDAMEDLFERKANERAQILARVKEDNTSDDQATKILAEMEAKYEVLQSDVQLEATSALDKRHAEEQLALRQRQLSEISHAIEQLAPEDILKKKQAEQAQRQEEELREFKEAMDQEQKDQIERIKAEKEKFEEELRKKNEDEMKELESQHRKVMEEERVQAEKKIRERRATLLKEQELSQQNHMKRLGKLDEEEKKVLQQRFREDRERVAAALEAERLRQERALEEKLRVRRMKKALRKEELLRKRMELEHKRMQRRIEGVNSTMASTLNAMMGKTVFKVARGKGLFSGEKSAVQMSIVSKMANKWRNASLAAKAKAKADIAKLSGGTPAERRAAREVSKGFWKQESDASNEESRLEREKKANLEHVKKLQMKMEEELNKKGAEMSDRQRRQHERLLKKLELKKKRAAAKAEKLEKEKKKQEALAIKEAQKSVEAVEKAGDNVVSGFGAILDESKVDDKSSNLAEAVPAMIIPESVTKEQVDRSSTELTGAMVSNMGSFNPASEKRMLDKLNKIETMLEQFASSRKISINQSASDVNNPEHSSMKFDYEEDDDDFNSSLAERLGKYKAFQQNPELIDFLHRHG